MLVFDHVGCLVNDIEKAIDEYSKFTNSKISDTYIIESQNVKVCFFGEIEFIQPLENSNLHRMIKKGITFYHVAYKSDNFDNDIKNLIKNNYMIISKPFNSIAFNNKRCQFVRNNLYHLIEIIENT